MKITIKRLKEALAYKEEEKDRLYAEINRLQDLLDKYTVDES